MGIIKLNINLIFMVIIFADFCFFVLLMASEAEYRVVSQNLLCWTMNIKSHQNLEREQDGSARPLHT